MSTRDDFIAQAYETGRISLLRFLKRKLGNKADAEDIVQESFARWSASRMEDRPDNPKAYVTRIAINVAHESAGRLKRERSFIVAHHEDETVDFVCAPQEAACPQRHTENRQMLDRIQEALQELPERQCEAFTLHRFDGLSYEEIAATMQISRALVSRHISRAVAYCRLRVNYPSQQAMRSALSSGDFDHEA